MFNDVKMREELVILVDICVRGSVHLRSQKCTLLRPRKCIPSLYQQNRLPNQTSIPIQEGYSEITLGLAYYEQLHS